MAKYQFKIALKPRDTNDDGSERVAQVDAPTIEDLEAALLLGLGDRYGDDFNISVGDGERTDVD